MTHRVKSAHLQRRQREQQRLGHGRALQIEHVGVERVEQGGQRRTGSRGRERLDRRRQGGGCDPVLDDRERDGEAPGPIEVVDLDRQHVDQMGQGQPDGADLLPAGRQAVEDAPRDDEVRLGVVMGEGEAGACVPDRGAEPRRDRARAEPQGNEAERPQGLGHAGPTAGVGGGQRYIMARFSWSSAEAREIALVQIRVLKTANRCM